MPAFIETQFPISRLSVEAYKERKANVGQTLPCLGKWWGRKPLILVRASILGMIMPSSDDPKMDREIFLKILTMDDDGAWQRNKGKIKERTTFDKLSYADRIKDCTRPENIEGPTKEAWKDINNHLGTTSLNLPDLVDQLGKKLFGHRPRVGDCFCGGGSIPFEAARIGCSTFGSDLNPVAGLLTWAALNLLGGGKDLHKVIMQIQEKIFNEADSIVTEWGIEHNENGERADAYIYCVEVRPEGCDYFIPLAPSWLIGERSKVVVKWEKDPGKIYLQPHIVSVSEDEIKQYKAKYGATIVGGRIVDPFNDNRSWSMEAMRGPTGLRPWINSDITPQSSDVFQERLYCIRWVDKHGNKRYAAPNVDDIAREKKSVRLLLERFEDWQKKGFIPSNVIEKGYNTDQPVRERGWTHWHQLFTPRQLLIHGLMAEISSRYCTTKESSVACLLGIGRIANWNSKLCMWMSNAANEGGSHVFNSQSLNTFYNYSNRPITKLDTAWPIFTSPLEIDTGSENFVSIIDAREIKQTCDIWITDPPYADAINYHELGDFFLSWYKQRLNDIFPEWHTNSRAELAVRGDGEDFRRSMVDIYKNLADHMPDDGLQMVMFTHQNPAVWADLGMILWAAGLKATAAWTISTETQAVGIKKGNYVQGTVCLVLRKRLSDEPGFLDEVYPLVEDEVKKQITSMRSLDEGGEPNFNDADYQLAAYAAALKVLTQYGNLDGKDVEYEVFAVRSKTEKSDFQTVIERALQIACDILVPNGLENSWRYLSLVERYYLRALDIESRGERRKGMYEELARGFGVADIKPLLKSDKANGTRMFTPSGLATRTLAPVEGNKADSDKALSSTKRRAGSNTLHPFASSSLRHLMFALRETTSTDNNPEPGRQYLRDTLGQAYWTKREAFIALLEWMSLLGDTEGMEDWIPDSEAARILSGRLRNDHA